MRWSQTGRECTANCRKKSNTNIALAMTAQSRAQPFSFHSAYSAIPHTTADNAKYPVPASRISGKVRQ